MATTTKERAGIVEKYRQSDNDTGSADVQVALLTDRILYMTEHLKTHKKDHHSRRGLLLMVAKRTKLLRYLSQTKPDRYKALIKKLGLRR